MHVTWIHVNAHVVQKRKGGKIDEGTGLMHDARLYSTTSSGGEKISLRKIVFK
jgi:hypothetical protein